MYITQFEITDLRCFKGTHTVSLDRGDGTYPGWTVVAGRNGAGKTTLLRALALAVIGPDAANGLVGTFSKWVSSGKEAARAVATIQADRALDRLGRMGQVSEPPVSADLSWDRGEQDLDRLSAGPTSSTRFLNGGGFNLSIGPPNQLIFGPWAQPPEGWFIAGYGAARRLGPATSEHERKRANPAFARLLSLFDDTATLSDAIDWLQKIHTKALEKRNGFEALKQSVIDLLNDGLLPPGSTVEGVDSDGLWVRRDGVSLVLDQVSDGYRVVTALVLDLVQRLYDTWPNDFRLERSPNGHLACHLPGVVLIDEVDAHLHVEWQQRIGFWLVQHFPQIQFLVTTHSPFVCQAASPRGIIRLPAPGEDRRIEVIEGRDFTQIVGGGADGAVRSLLFGLEHAHSEPAEQIRRRLAELERTIVLDQATPEDLTEYEALKGQIPNTLGEVAARRRRAMVGEP